jgi:hypothetical protein
MNRKKLALEPASLRVDSFEVAEPTAGDGTVEAHAAPCTAYATCKCQTSLYACGTVRYTAYSCPATAFCL